MSSARTLRRFVYLTCGVGVALQSRMCLWKIDPHDVGSLVFLVTLFVVGVGPYASCFFLAKVARQKEWAPLAALLGSLAVLGVDAMTFESVFLNPQSSTAGLGMLFAPVLTYPAATIGVVTGYFLGRGKTPNEPPPTTT
ncbi:MAG: hypothetical protein H6721_25660 [Sandaracinus sp.]|nr:hypothetical protein [Sandaracinus sp.]MCB9614087.1 hypothetical protein [Sandaracinus sp.]MCB9623777.1 hypothetical protein [Sandaracinus sp.]MCB9635519.1 hypothetical protein [Sandaracinus sp.]